MIKEGSRVVVPDYPPYYRGTVQEIWTHQLSVDTYEEVATVMLTDGDFIAWPIDDLIPILPIDNQIT